MNTRQVLIFFFPLVNTLCSIMCLILTASTQIRCGIWVLTTIFCSFSKSPRPCWFESPLKRGEPFIFRIICLPQTSQKVWTVWVWEGIKGRRIMLWPLPPRLLSPLNSSRIALITKYKGYSQNHTLFNYCWHITRQLHVLVLTVRESTEYSPRV